MSLSELLANVQELRQEFDGSLATVANKEELEKLRVSFVGRKGRLSTLRSEIPKLPVSERKSFGAETNGLQKHIETTIAKLRIELHDRQLAETLQRARADIDLPVIDSNEVGARHPVSLLTAKVHDIFRQLGFSIMDGPDIDFVEFNFTKLNIPEHHPARDMHDTFYLRGDQQLLRTHTSNVQIHTMARYQPPMRVISTGRCFRCDLDLTHTPMFHQLEGFMIDDNISFAHMKGTIETFIKELYGKQSLRFRPSYFPFVEPGAEVDMACVACNAQGCRVCKGTSWLEVAGCGMIHPNVFEALNIDSERYSGFAFGFGIDRLAMLYYGITDLRSMFSGRSDFLGQFPLC